MDQAQISLRELLLGAGEDGVHINTNAFHGGGAGAGTGSGFSGSTSSILANRGQQQEQEQGQDSERAPINSNTPTYYLSSNGTTSEPPSPSTTPHTPLARLNPLTRHLRTSFSNLSTPSNSTADKSPPGFSTPPGPRGPSVLPVMDGSAGQRNVSVDSRTSTVTSSDGLEDGGGGFSFVAGDSFKAGGSTVGSTGVGGEDDPDPLARDLSSGSSSKQSFVRRPPTPSRVRVAGLLGVCVKR